MRHVRIRPGSETASTEDDALSLYKASNVMIDHSSFEFAPWNNIDAVSDDWQVSPMTDVTIQDSVIADPTGQQFGAHTESVSSQMAWYRNIFANSHNRNPLAKVNTVFVNNLLYNDSAGYTTHTSTNFKHDILNNYFVFGPASTGTDNTWYQVDKNQAIYYAGNLKDTNRDGTLNGAATTPYWYQGEGTVLTSAVVGGDQRHPGARHAVRGARRDLAGRDAAARSDGRADHQPGDDAGQRNDRPRCRHGRPRRRPLHQPDADRPAEQRLRIRSPAARGPPTPTTTACPTTGRAPTDPT